MTMVFRCPGCDAQPLSMTEAGGTCPRCGARYPRVRGVLRFVTSEHYSGSFGYQWNRFARTQLDSANGTTRSRDAFVEKTGWRLEDLRGLRILDAGCGMGRFAEVCADAGAEVHGIDLSSAVDAAAANLGSRPNVSIHQADILNLPFAPGTFDRIYSLGVLHHTPDTRRAFLSLVPLLKPGGEIAIWVYDSSLRYVMAGSLLWRHLTTRLPQPTLLKLCRLAVPMYHVHRLPLLGFLTRRALPTSMDDLPDWRWLDTFDWYAPHFQYKHSLPEVRGWFEEAGLTAISHQAFPVSVRGTRPA